MYLIQFKLKVMFLPIKALKYWKKEKHINLDKQLNDVMLVTSI